MLGKRSWRRSPLAGRCPSHPADLAASQRQAADWVLKEFSGLVWFFFLLFFLSSPPSLGSMSKDCRACSASQSLWWLLGNVCSEGCPGMEITFLFICLPCKFEGLAAPNWAGPLSLHLWDSSGRARSHEQ